MKDVKIVLTPQGYLDLETELNELKNVVRPRVIKDLKEARAQGDLIDNQETEKISFRIGNINTNAIEGILDKETSAKQKFLSEIESLKADNADLKERYKNRFLTADEKPERPPVIEEPEERKVIDIKEI